MPALKRKHYETRYSPRLPRSERNLLLRQQIRYQISNGKRKLQHRGLL